MNAAAGIFLAARRKASTPTARSYVQDGLIAMWDGRENAGWGVHDAEATTWKDLVGGYDGVQRTTTGWSWSNDAYVGTLANGHGFAVPTTFTSVLKNNIAHHTVEFVFKPANTNRKALFSQYSGTGTGFEFYSNNTFRAYYGGMPDKQISAWDATLPCKTISLTYSNPNDLVSDTSLNMYVNGKIGNTLTYLIQPTQIKDSNAFILGGENSRNNMSIQGELHCVRVYLRALTAEEIAANHAVDKARFNLP